MARTISDIKKTMTDAFMADQTVREKYKLSSEDTFNSAFSKVSLENILFYIVAACCHFMEVIFEKYSKDVDDKISSAVVASVPWYWKIATGFQYGDALVFDEATQQYIYANEDDSKKVVKYAAVRDRGTSVEILVAGDNNGRPVALSTDILSAFENYMNRVKIAGVVLNIYSREADSLIISASVTVDPLVIDRNGVKISDGTRPVETAIDNYLNNIVYGGTLNKTKLVDAIQSVEGVSDVLLGECQYKTADDQNYSRINGNNYTAAGGFFVSSGLRNSISYVVSI